MSMRNKKKVGQQKQKLPQNKVKTLITSDNKEFKIIDFLLIRYSNFLKTILEEEKEEEIKLPGLDGQAMEYIQEFMLMHKQKQPMKMSLPIKSNQQLRLIMEQPDAIFVETIINKGDKLFKKVLDATQYLESEQFKKRLIAGLVIKLTKRTVHQLKEQYGISDKMSDFSQDEIRKQIRQKFEVIAESGIDE